MISEFLKKVGLSYEALNEEERRTLTGWLESLSTQQTSPKDIENYIRQMTDSVAKELCEYEIPRRKDIFLKARLKNYLLLLDFLTAPDKAKESLERYLKKSKLT